LPKTPLASQLGSRETLTSLSEAHFNAGTTVTVQRSVDNSNWLDVDTFTSTGESVGYEPELIYYRAGIKAGEFGAGTNIFIRFGGKWITGVPVA
jgi:hypothetical protein